MIEVTSAGRMPDDALDPGADVPEVRLFNDSLELRLLALGAAIAAVRAPDSTGEKGPVHLGLEDLGAYADRAQNPHFGASIGRYSNRIAGASFELDGTRYTLSANNGADTLHGGADGWDRHVWDLLEAAATPGGGTAAFRFVSPDGDQGFPGAVEATALYELVGDTLRISYSAATDAPTVVAMTNHGYWNLDGLPTVAAHQLALAADEVLPVDDSGIPTGPPEPVDGSAFDLRARTEVGPAMGRVSGGFDHCFAVRGEPGVLRPAAVLDSPTSGRWMSVATDQRGIQLYTGNHLAAPFVRHGSVSLETQAFPDSPNRPELGSVRLDPGREYRNITELRFGVGAPPQLPAS